MHILGGRPLQIAMQQQETAREREGWSETEEEVCGMVMVVMMLLVTAMLVV